MVVTIPDLTDGGKLEVANITAKIKAIEHAIEVIQGKVEQNRLNLEAKIAELRTTEAGLRNQLGKMLTVVQT